MTNLKNPNGWVNPSSGGGHATVVSCSPWQAMLYLQFSGVGGGGGRLAVTNRLTQEDQPRPLGRGVKGGGGEVRRVQERMMLSSRRRGGLRTPPKGKKKTKKSALTKRGDCRGPSSPCQLKTRVRRSNRMSNYSKRHRREKPVRIKIGREEGGVT